MKYKNPDIQSSYHTYDLGKTLYDYVLKHTPKTIFEFGTLRGYSAVAMAMALHELKEGHLFCYDLWDSYPFAHVSMTNTQDTLDRLGLSEFVTLRQGDVFKWEPEPCDLIHLDISNDGEKLTKLVPKLKGTGAVVLFEGGTLARDKVQWMDKYNRQPIRSAGIKFELVDDRFPGISKLL